MIPNHRSHGNKTSTDGPELSTFLADSPGKTATVGVTATVYKAPPHSYALGDADASLVFITPVILKGYEPPVEGNGLVDFLDLPDAASLPIEVSSPGSLEGHTVDSPPPINTGVDGRAKCQKPVSTTHDARGIPTVAATEGWKRRKGLIPKDVREIIERVPCTCEGEYSSALFALARELCALRRYVKAGPSKLSTAIIVWAERNGLKSPSKVWTDFLNDWHSVRWPAGFGKSEKALARARMGGAVNGIEEFVAWCLELQLIAGDKPFHMSGRRGERGLGVGRTKVQEWIAELLDTGVLVCVFKGGPRHPWVTKGTRKVRRASEYHYCGVK